MGDFLYTYSTSKYSSEPLQMEFTYNFSAGLDRSVRHQHTLVSWSQVSGDSPYRVLPWGAAAQYQ